MNRERDKHQRLRATGGRLSVAADVRQQLQLADRELVHYQIDVGDGRKVRSIEQLLDEHRAACKPASVTTEPRSLFPRLVTCTACLDWIAANHTKVIARLDELRTA